MNFPGFVLVAEPRIDVESPDTQAGCCCIIIGKMFLKRQSFEDLYILFCIFFYFYPY